ncbi:MAG: trigger factor [Bacteroidales bacterium]|nr:trigger factor [Bacteroidales bacterium]MBN2762071.1 trigger factor [Bacteroidales bacterium]
MNITRNNIDELNAVVKIIIEKSDYGQKVESILKDYRKKAKIDGFRPGMVPMGMIRKIAGKQVLAEEVNKILEESLNDYFRKENLMILGDPLPHEDNAPEIDWDTQTEFEFVFDIGIAPDFDAPVNNKEKIPFYKIKIDNEARNQHIDRLRFRFGSFRETQEVSGNEMIKADIVQVDKDGEPVPEGIKVEDVSMHLDYMKDEKIRKRLKGKRAGDQLVVDLVRAYPNEVDLAAMLKTDKEKLKEIRDEFRLTIKSVSVFEKPELNQEFYDKVYGNDVVKTPEEFTQQIDKELTATFERESEYKFSLDVKDYYLKKFKKNLPADFLKRWLLKVNEGKLNEEQLEKDFEQFTGDLKWQLIKSKITRENDIQIKEEELRAFIQYNYRMQFMQYYGIANVPEETLANYVEEALKNKSEIRRYAEKLNENKVFDLVRKNVKLDEKEVTLEKFNKMLEK